MQYDIVVYFDTVTHAMSVVPMVRGAYAYAVALNNEGDGPCAGVFRVASRAWERARPDWVRVFDTASLVTSGKKCFYVVCWAENGLAGIQTETADNGNWIVYFNHERAIARRNQIITHVLNGDAGYEDICADIPNELVSVGVFEVASAEDERPGVAWYRNSGGPTCVCNEQ